MLTVCIESAGLLTSICRQRCIIRYPLALRHHVNTVHVIVVMTSLNSGVDIICLRAVEPDSTGQGAQTYDTEDACIAGRLRFLARLDATHELMFVVRKASALLQLKDQ